MWSVSLINDFGNEIAHVNIQVKELILDDIADLGWYLADGDSIVITKLED